LKIDAILNLDKPKGRTSFDMVAFVRRLSGERRVGHAGTLDPEATGVLPICIGKGTRLTEFLVEGTKAYRAEIELGVATDTYDATGTITHRGDTASLSLEQVGAAVDSFTGIIDQLPPAYSAIKYRGRPLYRWTRAGIEVPRKPRQVEFSELLILSWEAPLLNLEVECSKGTYIRSLAHDLGQRLGCGAHLRNLVRLRSGPFHVSDSVSAAAVQDAFERGHWPELVHPIDVAVLHLPPVTVNADDEQAIVNGRPPVFRIEEENQDRQCRAYSTDGRFLAILRYDESRERWQPTKVFAAGI
jgi:tRNA pseudouridine55 synthase